MPRTPSSPCTGEFLIKDADEATSTPSIYTSSEGTAANQPQLAISYV
jgi:hypothetical protein